MAGTPEGGRKAALKNLQRDPTFYSRNACNQAKQHYKKKGTMNE